MLFSAENFDIKKLKLVIWDLDNTFWNGTISEGPITHISENIELVKALTAHGVVNAICSKNTFEVCQRALEEIGIWDYFVFPSIDWTPKSNRVHRIIADMNLRPANTLFLDDEPSNLQRALHVNDALMCGTSQELAPAMWAQLDLLPIDEQHKRLKQYKDLQTKVETQKSFDSDEEFLRIADIKVSIHYDCQTQQERIFEMIHRTNQLNFTKYREDKQPVIDMLADSNYTCAYVSCVDKFCDYGIVGFLAIDNEKHRFKHFLFSCRTIGMGVEQFIYAHFNFPELTVVGEVVTELNKKDKPDWIHLVEIGERNNICAAETPKGKFLLKGPCDVSQIIPYFADESIFDTEFTYISQSKKGIYIESFNHTSQILLADQLSEAEKQELAERLPFIDSEFYNTTLFTKEYDYVVLSMLDDYGLGMYRNRHNPKYNVVFGQFTVDYTKSENWDNIMKLWCSHQEYDKSIAEQYSYFQGNYEYIGRISDEQMIANLQQIRNRLPKHTKLLLLNGAEIPYSGECKASLKDRDKLHVQLNKVVQSFVEQNADNCAVLNINDYLIEESPYLDTINHYKKAVYYRLAEAIRTYAKKTDAEYELKTRNQNQLYMSTQLKRVMGKLDRIKTLIVTKGKNK